MFTDDRPPFERQHGEPARAFHSFCHFRDGGPGISIDKAWREHKTACDHVGLNEVSHRRRPTTWARWSAAFDWVGRREVYLTFLDQQRRGRFLKMQLDAVERHQRLIAAALNVTSIPVRAILNRLADPAFLAGLEKQTEWGLLRDSWRALEIVPSLINAERQALGLSQMEVVVDDRRLERAFADRLVSDPLAVHLAVELLDQIARTPDEGESKPSDGRHQVVDSASVT